MQAVVEGFTPCLTPCCFECGPLRSGQRVHVLLLLREPLVCVCCPGRPGCPADCHHGGISEVLAYQRLEAFQEVLLDLLVQDALLGPLGEVVGAIPPQQLARRVECPPTGSTLCIQP